MHAHARDTLRGVAASQPGGFRQVDAKPIAAALVAAGHFGAGVAELSLHVAFLDFRRRGEAGA